jgi:hypothetical protein
MKIGLFAIAVIVGVFYSCTKTNNSTGSFNQSFRYTVRGSAFAIDSSAAYLSGIANRPTILAWNKGSLPATFKIGLSVTSLQLGSYLLSPTVPGSDPTTGLTNRLYYFDENRNELKVVDGGVNILANEDFRISGDFTANLLDVQGAPVSITGTFTDIPIKR